MKGSVCNHTLETLMRWFLLKFSFIFQAKHLDFSFHRHFKSFFNLINLFTATLRILRHVVGLSTHAVCVAQFSSNASDVHDTTELL